MATNPEVLESVRAKAAEWLTGIYDESTKLEVRRMLNNEDSSELIDSFYRDLRIWYRWIARYYGSWNQPDEYLYRWRCHSGIK